jgi:hypothetical protein
MKKTSICLITLLLASLLLCFSQSIVAAGSADYTVSGYVLDPNGNPVANAKVRFIRGSAPWPTCYTNDSGYYQLKPYSGVNSVTIAPPSNTNYVYYIENSFNVTENMTANFTLSLGYRLSGLVVDQNLQPIKSGAYMEGGVGIFLDSYFSGTWADSNGAYYVVAPAGNYTIHARHCEAGSWGSVGYSAEYEVINGINISLNSNLTANIVVSMPNVTPAPTPEGTPTITAEPTANLNPPSEATSEPTPAVPETPAWIIIPLGLLLSAMACCFMVKNKRLQS